MSPEKSKIGGYCPPRPPKEDMRTTLDGIIHGALINMDGLLCQKCGQIAFRILMVNVGGVEGTVPLCGRHYIGIKKDSGQPS